MKNALLVLAAATVMTPVAASAQTAGPTFSGPYIGVSAGWNQGSEKNVLPGPGGTSEKRSGVAVRGSAGYDVAVGEHALVGAEVGVATGGRDIQTNNVGNGYRTNPKIALDAAARIGVKPVDRLLLFGKVGWGFQRVQTTLSTPTATFDRNSSENGLLFGGGAEVAVTKNVALKVDYDRTSFNDHYKRDRVLGGVSFRF